MIHDATDALIRRAAFEHLARLRDVEGELLSWGTLTRGFEFRGERVHLLSQQGIFKPRQLALPLSIRTTASPYADSLGDGCSSTPSASACCGRTARSARCAG